MKTLLTFLLTGLLFLQAGVIRAQPVPVTVLEHFGTLDKVYQVGNLYFAGQPDKTTLQYFRNRGGVTVINLRDPSETQQDERALAREIGLRYYNFPVAKKQPVNPSIMLATSWAIEREGAVPILVHCSSGNRAAVALAAHFTRTLGLGKKEAVQAAEAGGLTKPGTREKLNQLLEKGLAP